MPRLQRYALAQVVSGIIGIAVFFFYWKDAGWEAAFNRGILTFVSFVALTILPQYLRDWLRIRKGGAWLDEMEKAIADKSRTAGFMADYGFFAGVILTIAFVYEHKGIELFRVSNFRFIVLGALFVLLVSQSIATLVLYGRMRADESEEIRRTPGTPSSGEQP